MVMSKLRSYPRIYRKKVIHMKILNADSKLMQSFRLLFDYMGVNIVFLVFSIPIITIGSAHTAFYTAMRAMQRNQPWLKLFIETFKKSIKVPTIIWCICLPLIIIMSVNVVNMFSLGMDTIAIISCVCLGIAMCVATMAPMLYSRFECTVMELLRNSVMMLVAYPIQVVLGTALTWAPVAVFFFLAWLFLETVPWIILLYFSVAGAIYTRMMRYPFGRLAGELPEKEDSFLIKEAKKRVKKTTDLAAQKNKD